MNVQQVIGVDFSGAKEAGRNIWLAEGAITGGRLRLRRLDCLETLAGVSLRDAALGHLVDRIRGSKQTLWAIDFPFALPIELTCMGAGFAAQLQTTADYAHDAAEFGRWLLGEAKKLGGKNHIRRQTDSEAKTPFDCYHYRIIYQTFHGMRDVLRPLAADRATCILPFQYNCLPTAERVVIEACPSTTLKKLGLPHQMYKQPAGGPLMDAIAVHIDVPLHLRRVMARNPGGDAIDAVLAAVGAWRCWSGIDHGTIAAHERYPREGYVYG
jgi:hypothetical protein